LRLSIRLRHVPTPLLSYTDGYLLSDEWVQEARIRNGTDAGGGSMSD
jgi:hypothetical protein